MTRTRLGRWVVLSVFALVVFGAIVVVHLAQPQLSPGEARAQALARKLDRALDRPRTYDAPGVAVFALAAPAEDRELGHLSLALCDALVERLLRQGALRLPSCASARVAAEAGVGGAQLAHLLGVDYAVRGSIARLPDGRFRAQIAMASLRDEQSQWQIDEEVDDARLQELLAQVTARIADSAGRPLARADEQRIEPKAYGKYLKAMQLTARRNVDEMREAQRLIDEVLAVAPDYVPALYARLGLTSQLMSAGPPPGAGKRGDDGQVQQAAMLREIDSLGRRLLAADPTDWRAHALLLNFAFQNRRWAEAFAHADALAAVGSKRAGGLRINARLHLYAGYLRRGQELALEAARLDPLSSENYMALAQAFGLAGDDARMAEFAGIAAELGVKRAAMYEAFSALRRKDWTAFEPAYVGWQAAAGHSGDWPAAVARAVVDPSRRVAAVDALSQQEARVRAAMAGFFLEYGLLGETAQGVAAIVERSRLPPAGWLEYLWWPELSALRTHEDFVQAMENLGLAALWRERGEPDRCAQQANGRWRCT
jgi:TolB-like protein